MMLFLFHNELLIQENSSQLLKYLNVRYDHFQEREIFCVDLHAGLYFIFRKRNLQMATM